MAEQIKNGNNTENTVSEELDLNEILRVRREKLAALVAAGDDPYEEDKFVVSDRSEDIKKNFDELNGKDVRIAGRIVSRRLMGKASFIHILDGEGLIQSYVRIDDVGEDMYKQFKEWDIGDVISVEGYVFKTKTEEVSVHAKKINLLSKSLLPLPEKFHGLKDPDLRYRQRYVDLIANPEVKETFKKRSRIISAVREYLDNQDFIEVETPILNTIAGGATARPFVTHHNSLDINMYLRISPELYLKRLIVGGFEKVYEIGRVFRNEGMDMKHNPEFTLMECYWAYANLGDMMDITEGVYRYICDKVLGTRVLNYQDTEIDFSKPSRRITMIDAVKEYTGLDFNVLTAETAYPKMKEMGFDVKPDMTWGKLLYEAFDQKVEEKLIQPTFILDYPIEVSPLTKKKKDDKRLTYRFEYFVLAREMGNAYSELNDPIDQKERFEVQVKEREKGDDEAMLMDNDFVTALEYGMPPTGGLGLGIDRMVMLFTNTYSIRDVLLFPTMKPLDSDKKVEKAAVAPVEAAPVVEEKIDFSNVVIEPLFEDFVDFETFSKSDFRAVKVLECEAVPKSKKLLKFTLDDGTGVNRTILSGIHAFYEPEELVGKTLIAITNLPPRPMMGIDSCGMLLSAINKRGEEEELHLLMVDNHIPAGAKLY